MINFQFSFPQQRRFRFAAGYVVQNEGTGVVERLAGGGEKTRFGVRQSWVPGRDLEDLTRPESEEILKEREWRFYGYQRLTRITIPAKIFDTHITFDFRPAIRFAQRALGVEETEDLDQKTIAEIENANSQDFFESYTSVLEDYVESDFGGDGALLRRVRAVPPRNVDSLDTFV